MIKRLKRSKLLKRYPNFPHENYWGTKLVYPKSYSGFQLYLPTRSAKGHANMLGKEFYKLMNLLGFERLNFMGLNNSKAFYQTHDYKPAIEGIEYLKKNKLSADFNGALVIPVEERAEFASHLFWLTRTNALLPYIYGADDGFNVILNICQYGILHIDVFNEEWDDLVEGAVDHTKFIITTERCYDRFSKKGAIRGRISTYSR